jgi:hypothetical protein
VAFVRKTKAAQGLKGGRGFAQRCHRKLTQRHEQKGNFGQDTIPKMTLFMAYPNFSSQHAGHHAVCEDSVDQDFCSRPPPVR